MNFNRHELNLQKQLEIDEKRRMISDPMLREFSKLMLIEKALGVIPDTIIFDEDENQFNDDYIFEKEDCMNNYNSNRDFGKNSKKYLEEDTFELPDGDRYTRGKIDEEVEKALRETGQVPYELKLRILKLRKPELFDAQDNPKVDISKLGNIN